MHTDKSARHGATGVLQRIRRGFGRDTSGATAVEFGLIALPFIAAMFAVLETALVFFAQQTLETATSTAARMIRTGQAQASGFSATDFRDEVCSRTASLFDCTNGLKVDVQTFPNFGSVDLNPPLDGDGNLSSNMNYTPGNGGDIVLVRAYYEWPIYIRLLGLDLSNMPNGKRLMAATAAFRNEPFPW